MKGRGNSKTTFFWLVVLSNFGNKTTLFVLNFDKERNKDYIVSEHGSIF